ncbi:TIGR00725 family protein [Antribacter gilvus]|uniref:TIGR00725 family protein n=1 Tax=Antribacter gilvus TaxID=2304675 RepID=UPI000F77885A|nr:TIGR00725 family protein [Antribacter gilvus]
MTVQITVSGPRNGPQQDHDNAYAVGRLLALAGAVVVTGGGPGVMEAACAGARDAGGTTLGILAAATPTEANPYVDVVVPTGMGEGRNAIVVASGQAMIVVGGSWGTLSEVGLAMRRGIPVVTVGGWHLRGADGQPLPDAPPTADTPQEAVDIVLAALRGKAG